MHALTRVAALAAAAISALALPTAALAHPSVYSTTALLAKSQEVQTITVDATSGTFQPSAGAPAVAENASALMVQLALEKDPAIGTGNISVTGSAGGPYTLRWVGAKIQTNEATVAPADVDLAGGGDTVIAALVTNGGTNITFGGDPTGATLPQQEFYVVAEHGYAPLLKETNGSNEGGMLNLKRLPGTYRGTPMTPSDWLTFAAAQTDVQPHPVCEGVPALTTPANILAANGDPTQPFWNYVPFTKTPAGIDDVATEWTDVLTTVLTAPVLNATNTPAEFKTACETTLGGVYRPADAAGATSPIYSAALTDATTPLNNTITAKVAEIAAKAARIVELEAALKRPLELTLSSKRFSAGDTALLTGPNGSSAKVIITVSKTLAKTLGLKSTTLGAGYVKLNGQGAAIAELNLTKAATKAIAKRRFGTPVTVTTTAGALTDSAAGTLLR